MTLMTIFTDASHLPSNGKSGWGAFFRTDRMNKGQFIGASIPFTCTSSNEAEFAGIAFGVQTALTMRKLDEIKTVLIECDNESALALVKRYRSNARDVILRDGFHPIPDGCKERSYEISTCGQLISAIDPNINILLKHVKGHQKIQKKSKLKTDEDIKNNRRAWVNSECDKIAKSYARSAIIRQTQLT